MPALRCLRRSWLLPLRVPPRSTFHYHRMYAWDIHCNAFFPMFLLLGVLQLALCPLLLMHRFVARILSAGARRPAAGC